MSGKVGGLSHKFYRETRGMKVSGGQAVKSGTVLTREGHRWKAGMNVIGRTSLTAGCAGEIYFTRKRGGYHQSITCINVRPVISESKPKAKAKAQAKVSG